MSLSSSGPRNKSLWFLVNKAPSALTSRQLSFPKSEKEHGYYGSLVAKEI